MPMNDNLALKLAEILENQPRMANPPAMWLRLVDGRIVEKQMCTHETCIA